MVKCTMCPQVKLLPSFLTLLLFFVGFGQLPKRRRRKRRSTKKKVKGKKYANGEEDEERGWWRCGTGRKSRI